MLRSHLAGSTRPVLVALSALLAAPLAGDQKLEAQVQLVRPAGASDADAQGQLELKSKHHRQEFELELKHVDGALPHDLWLETSPGSGQLAFVGTLTGTGRDGDDKLELELESEHGDPLPLGVTDVGQLLGRAAEVRVGSDVILRGTLPASFGANAERSGRSLLGAAAGAPDVHSLGVVELSAKPNKGRQRLEVVAKRVDGSALHELFMDDGTGALALVGPLRLVVDDDDDDEPVVEYKVRTKKGEALPANLTSVAQLLGRRIEVRADGAVVAFAHIPTTFEADRDDDQELEVRFQAAGAGWVRGELELEIDERGREELEIQIEGVDVSRHHELFVESLPGNGDLVKLVDMSSDHAGWPLAELELEIDSKDGQPLPFGARTVDDLLGRRVEVRANGQPVLSGQLPAAFTEHD